MDYCWCCSLPLREWMALLGLNWFWGPNVRIDVTGHRSLVQILPTRCCQSLAKKKKKKGREIKRNWGLHFSRTLLCTEGVIPHFWVLSSSDYGDLAKVGGLSFSLGPPYNLIDYVVLASSHHTWTPLKWWGIKQVVSSRSDRLFGLGRPQNKLHKSVLKVVGS